MKCLLNNCFPCVEGVVEGDLAAVEAYKSSGGDIARQLSSDEVRLLNRPSAFDDGFTLVHLAIRFQRQDMLAVLLTEVSRVSVHSLRPFPERSWRCLKRSMISGGRCLIAAFMEISSHQSQKLPRGLELGSGARAEVYWISFVVTTVIPD